MSVVDEQNARNELIDRILVNVSKLPKSDQAPFTAFLKAYYSRPLMEDLLQRNPVDLYGAALSHWHLLKSYRPNDYKIQIYNPQFEQHGWQSAHTIIEIVHPNMPFLVDSIRSELNRIGYFVHIMIYTGGLVVRRDKSGLVEDIDALMEKNALDGKEVVEAVYVEINNLSADECQRVMERLTSILKDVRSCVADWKKLTQKVDDVIASVENMPDCIEEDYVREMKDYLEWVKQNNFTFIAYYELALNEDDQGKYFQTVEGSGLGVLREKRDKISYRLEELPDSVAEKLTSPHDPLLLSKTSTISTVHRPVYTDSITVKIYNEAGEVSGQHKLIGLYTSSAYNRRPHHIPILRVKVSNILKRARVHLDSHDGKEIYNILETLPRDDLFQASEEEIYEWAIGIHHLQERLRVRLFLRRDTLGGYYSCLVFVPRDKFNSELRQKIQELLMEALGGYEVHFATTFSESVLARIHYTVKTKRDAPELDIDCDKLESQLAEASMTWNEEFLTALAEQYGEKETELFFKQFQNAFPAGYRDQFMARTAVFDLKHILEVCEGNPLSMSIYRPMEDDTGILRFKLFQLSQPIPLSDVVPMLENFGLEVINERPHEITLQDGRTVWLNDFCMKLVGDESIQLNQVREKFQDAFYHIWNGDAEDDGFNRLILLATLNWREVSVLRAYSKYLWQTGFTFTQAYVERSLSNNPTIARTLIDLFSLRFEPGDRSVEDRDPKEINESIAAALDEVESLDEDKILRRIHAVMLATLRTNYYQNDEENAPKAYISFKLDPKSIPELPKPLPMFETFVYAPWVEGVHLRTAKVARGGLRWSDRREDFRTEVLGLVKAQRVKNSVIVPMGAKGGFCPKKLPTSSREAFMKEGVRCYQTFIKGLLDIADNFVDKEVVPPKNVVRYDPDDYYLVVAADKGTATFSDIANEIAKSYGFWLGDAFASGGSDGYDHKKMGITARGAWESVKRHFREMNIDCQSQDFTVIGIGDMSGDVFGNGMLLSKHTRLLGAFNHMHIFVDPSPDAAASFEERKRLFELPRSQWTDYNPELISEGGGVFSRHAKWIKVSPQMKTLFAIDEDTIEPNALIRIMLKTSVDLLWNGGIGTYTKARSETDLEVGDRANDSVRVYGDELRCKIVGEGGNLGFTQLSRIEYALNGGRLNTDAIDNSAGVDCSDHEVNIKILLNDLVQEGDLTEKQRNQLLVQMTDEVGDLCLDNNRKQNEAISVAMFHSPMNLQMQSRLMVELEAVANLDRDLEFLPDTDALAERQKSEKGLTRPEFAVLMAYTKIYLKEQILLSSIPDEPHMLTYLEAGFPKVLKEQYPEVMQRHQLSREIIATNLSNAVVNEMGINFVHRLKDETGAETADIIRSYMVSRASIDYLGLKQAIHALDFKVDSKWQSQMLYEVNRLARRATRWFIRNRQWLENIQETIDKFAPAVEQVSKALPTVLKGTANEIMTQAVNEYLEAGVPSDLAYRVGAFAGLTSSFDIVHATLTHQLPITRFIEIYYSVGWKLNFGWFREQIKLHPVKNNWDALARAAFRDSLDAKQSELAILVMKNVLEKGESVEDVVCVVEDWLDAVGPQVKRWQRMVEELKALPIRDYTMYSVALKELMDVGTAPLQEERKTTPSDT